MLIVVSYSGEPRGTLFFNMLQNLKLVFRKMEVFICGIRGQGKMSVRLRRSGCSYHHTDRNELAEKFNLIAPVLFSRNGKLGFEPEGSYQQLNDVFAEMVAWHMQRE